MQSDYTTVECNLANNINSEKFYFWDKVIIIQITIIIHKLYITFNWAKRNQRVRNHFEYCIWSFKVYIINIMFVYRFYIVFSYYNVA